MNSNSPALPNEIQGANKPRPSSKFRRALTLIGAALAGTLSATTTVTQLERARKTIETEMSAAAQKSAPAAQAPAVGVDQIAYVNPTRRMRRMGITGPVPYSLAKDKRSPKEWGQYLQSTGRQKWNRRGRA